MYPCESCTPLLSLLILCILAFDSKLQPIKSDEFWDVPSALAKGTTNMWESTRARDTGKKKKGQFVTSMNNTNNWIFRNIKTDVILRNYRKWVLNFPSTWSKSWWYTGGGPRNKDFGTVSHQTLVFARGVGYMATQNWKKKVQLI